MVYTTSKGIGQLISGYFKAIAAKLKAITNMNIPKLLDSFLLMVYAFLKASLITL
jgi:hypothetical protein